jgi:glucose/arabinose dehydrogenase
VPAISPAGLLFYTGDKIKDWKGKALLGGLSSEALIVVSVDGNQVTGDEIIKLGKRIREVAQAPDGAVLLCCWTARAAAISCGLRRPGEPEAG